MLANEAAPAGGTAIGRDERVGAPATFDHIVEGTGRHQRDTDRGRGSPARRRIPQKAGVGVSSVANGCPLIATNPARMSFWSPARSKLSQASRLITQDARRPVVQSSRIRAAATSISRRPKVQSRRSSRETAHGVGLPTGTPRAGVNRLNHGLSQGRSREGQMGLGDRATAARADEVAPGR